MTIKNNYFNNQRFIQSINRRLYTIENKLRIALSHRHKPIRIALEKNNDFVRCQIQDEIEDLISDKLLRSEFSPGQTIELDVKNSSIQIKKSRKKIKKQTSEDLDDKEVIVS